MFRTVGRLLLAQIVVALALSAAPAPASAGCWFPGKLALRSAGAAARVTARGARGVARVAWRTSIFHALSHQHGHRCCR